MPTAPLIDAFGLTRRYGQGTGAITALNSVNLRVEAGEFLAVTGPSGSGKTTLMNLIALLDAPTAGALRFRGADVTGAPDSALAGIRNRHIGFVFQAYHLLPRRTVLGNVELPLLYGSANSAERRRRATAALERVGLSDRTGAFPGELSGGEQQRVAIARALVGEPDLVVADEPTGALDTRTGASVLALLAAICAEGRTLIVVTHNRDVAALANRVVALTDGRVASDDGGTALPTGAR